MADYTQVRALLRGLDVLRALNRYNGGTVLDLVAETGLPRARSTACSRLCRPAAMSPRTRPTTAIA